MSTIYTAGINLANTAQEISLEGGGLVSALPSKLVVVRGNTQILYVEGMYDLEEQAFWSTAASLSGTLLDEFGNQIFTVTLLYASGSNGNFSGSFGGSQFFPPVGIGYTIVFQGTSDWGSAFNLPVPAEVITSPRFTGVGGATSAPVP